MKGREGMGREESWRGCGRKDVDGNGRGEKNRMQNKRNGSFKLNKEMEEGREEKKGEEMKRGRRMRRMRKKGRSGWQ